MVSQTYLVLWYKYRILTAQLAKLQLTGEDRVEIQSQLTFFRYLYVTTMKLKSRKKSNILV